MQAMPTRRLISMPLSPQKVFLMMVVCLTSIIISTLGWSWMMYSLVPYKEDGTLELFTATLLIWLHVASGVCQHETNGTKYSIRITITKNGQSIV